MNTSHECTLSFGFDVQNAGGRSHLGAKDKYTHLVYTSSQASYLKELIKSLFYFLFNILWPRMGERTHSMPFLLWKWKSKQWWDEGTSKNTCSMYFPTVCLIPSGSPRGGGYTSLSHEQECGCFHSHTHQEQLSIILEQKLQKWEDLCPSSIFLSRLIIFVKQRPQGIHSDLFLQVRIMGPTRGFCFSKSFKNWVKGGNPFNNFLKMVKLSQFKVQPTAP
jgi:hypothetical protein